MGADYGDYQANFHLDELNPPPILTDELATAGFSTADGGGVIGLYHNFDCIGRFYPDEIVKIRECALAHLKG